MGRLMRMSNIGYKLDGSRRDLLLECIVISAYQRERRNFFTRQQLDHLLMNEAEYWLLRKHVQK